MRSGGEVPREELEARWLDLEKGRGQVAQPMTADDMAEASRIRTALLDAYDMEMDKAATKAVKCVLRGLIVLLWVYLIDLMRRYVATHSLEELVFTLCPLGILVVAVSMFFCILMGIIDKHVQPTIPPPYKVSQANHYANSP
ncbi:unnamed protein product [Urochloa humidicola]